MSIGSPVEWLRYRGRVRALRCARRAHDAARECFQGRFVHAAIPAFADGVGLPNGLHECSAGVCHNDLLVRNDTSPKAITCAPAPLPAGQARAFSFIRTLTVGSGISPDLLTLRTSKALAGSPARRPHTAGRDFHPALRTPAC